jgi:recombination protein RecA
MSQALRKLAGALSKANCAAIFINQLREKVGVMYGNPEVTTGGRALKFYASVRIEIRRTETIKVGGEPIGNRTKAKVVKNKVAPPFKEAQFDIMYGEGISRTGEIIDLGVETEVLKRSGAWFYYGEMRLGQGRDNAKITLQENPELAKEISDKVMAKLQESTLSENAKISEKVSKEASAPKSEETDTKSAMPKISIDIAVDDE